MVREENDIPGREEPEMDEVEGFRTYGNVTKEKAGGTPSRVDTFIKEGSTWAVAPQKERI